jgi:Mor family transcriptional regulator
LRQRTAAGKSIAELATEFDLSKRTIHRIIRRLSNE